MLPKNTSKCSNVVICYNFRLSLGYNLGRDLSQEVGMDQLVKYKDIELYLQLYIPKDHEENIHYT